MELEKARNPASPPARQTRQSAPTALSQRLSRKPLLVEEADTLDDPMGDADQKPGFQPSERRWRKTMVREMAAVSRATPAAIAKIAR